MIAGLLKPGGLTCRRLCISGIRWWFPFFSLFATQPLPLLLHAPLLLVHPVRAFHIPPQATSDHYSRATPTTFFSKIMPSTRVKSTKSSEELDEKMNTVEESDAVASVTPPSTSSPKKKRRKNAAAATDSEELPTVDDGPGTSSPKKKAKTTKNKPKKKATTTGSDSESDGEGIPNAKKMAATKKTSSPKTKKAAEHQRITDRDEIPKLWNDDMAMANGSYTYRIASWNVAGLRAVLKNSPTALIDLCETHNLDMLCLQETKLQEIHLEDPKLKLKGCMEEHGYEEHWACSAVKKGYSGTAVFVKTRKNGSGSTKKTAKQTTIGSFFATSSSTDEVVVEKTPPNTEELPVDPEMLVPTKVTDKLGKSIDDEGRNIILDFPWGTVANVYVPNSGQKLERLDFRTKEWDRFFLEYMQTKHKDRNLPVMWLGDLNIAHKAYDIWNDGAKHLNKQAGVTPEERASFTEMLDAGFIDAFRHLHPDAKGHYSYWSQRAGNRVPNKGLRLDYFVCSPEFFAEDSKVIARDSYMLPEQAGSDHCPVILELEIKP